MGWKRKKRTKTKHQIRLNWTIKNDGEIDPNGVQV